MAALYLTHRPRSFDDVVGQEHVVRILRNALRRDALTHAYLLTGPRGTGKTTLARLLACAVNAPGGPRVDFDPDVGEAPRILDGTSLDLVREINAAQQNGIDDIRELQRSAALAPAQGSVKVYILDEAHAYSGHAANALLKLLEEPPSSVMFVLCTTEPGKLLATITSRCQHLALRRPSVGQLATALRRIADREGFEISDGALRLCARAGQGAFRDAIGKLEQATLSADGPVDEHAASQALGIVGEEIASKFTAAIIAREAPAVLQGVEELDLAGHDTASVLDVLCGWMRLIYLHQLTGGIPAEDDPGGEQHELLIAQASELSTAETLQCVDWLSAARKDIRDGVEARIAVEMALLRCARRDQQLDARVSRLERAAVAA